MKRQRGRRGLEVLQRIQKMPHLEIEIADDDFPNIADVDLKLIELAKRYDGKILTNDYNLNKVASLQGIEILNVNQLANALKPVVLPGETMRVFILREGKEYNQGVAYLDDGTMVVVDGARRMINKTIDITVTSVHQTTAGKMIFGRLDERAEMPGPRVHSAPCRERSAAPRPRTAAGTTRDLSAASACRAPWFRNPPANRSEARVGTHSRLSASTCLGPSRTVISGAVQNLRVFSALACLAHSGCATLAVSKSTICPSGKDRYTMNPSESCRIAARF